MKRFASLLTAAALSLTSLAAHAAWPDHSVRFIVPFPAGGPSDAAMRVVAKRLGELWGQPAVVENRPGAPGIVVAASAPADGYTFVLGAGSHMVTAPLMNPKLAYKPQRDFVPVSLLLTNTPVLTVHPSLKVKTLKDLISYAKAHPGELNYSSAGNGSPSHLMMEMFNDITGTKMTHIPYRGGAPSVQELLAGHVQLGINATPTVLQYVNTNKLTPLAVASARRDASMPNVPTMTEDGVPNFDYQIWYGIFAPANTPAAIVAKLSTDMQKLLAEPAIVQQMRAQGADAKGSTPQAFSRMVQADTAAWGKLIQEKKLSLDE
ncbi:tripartite tricarboxylate transporter substrate binding protein [Acidovorax sp. LjRoot118]|uniref:Bug family tripartite tricarboxylate transporter substrate binding protein n=1 Tax=unclassified Acidovorax TaxID=2684926 RepID=UPI0009E81A3B|nr:tripartite tricarboxylate transporter substrate binding protein [Acidovorax sp. Root217]